MKIITFLKSLTRDESRKSVPSSFSDFFLHASEKEKKEVLVEVAHRANKEQMRVFTDSRLREAEVH